MKFILTILVILSSIAGYSQLVISSSDPTTSVINSAVFDLTSVPAGALLVLTVGNNASINDNFGVTSSPSLTWTKRTDAGATNTGNAEVWTAVFTAGGTIAVTATDNGGDRMGGVCYAITGAEPTLGGAGNTQTAGNAPSVAVTTSRVNSILFAITSDWNGVDGASRTLRDAATETLYYHPDGNGTVYVYYKQCTAAESHTLGLSAPTGQIAATAVYEIRVPLTTASHRGFFIMTQ